MNKRVWPALLLVTAACTATTDPTTTTLPPTTTTVAVTTTTEPPTTAERLEALGGTPCPESDFTCVEVEVPLDHFGTGSETIQVTFAVLPASAEREGVFLTATGGPGTSGIAVADSYTSVLDTALTENFDMVFYDQRGMGLSGGLTCPNAALAYYRIDSSTALGFDEPAYSAAAEAFVADCLAELGSTELLPYLATTQVAEDIALFLDTMGYDRIVMYGESYGTQVAQTFAAAHGDRLERLVIDGVVDLTLDGFSFLREQAAAFGDTLQASFDACLEDPWCAGDLDGVDPGAAYDRLVALLNEGPLSAEFPLPGGGFATRTMGLADLELVAASQAYGEFDRMLFLRALAAHASRDDIVPMIRLLYSTLGVAPADESLIEDPTWSDAIFYAVECLDYHYPGATPHERAAAFFANADGFEGRRLGGLVLGDLPCAFWPASSDAPERPAPLTASGVPTLVLGATADPATPYRQGLSVLDRLEEGYSITQAGGPHIIFGRGNQCPDLSVTAFILDGTPPGDIECDGYVVDYYPPLFPLSIGEFPDTETFLYAVEDELTFIPELWYWNGLDVTTVGCSFGGSILAEPSDMGFAFSFTACALAPDTVLTGSATYDYERDVFKIDDISVGSTECLFSYQRAGEHITVSDDCEALFGP